MLGVRLYTIDGQVVPIYNDSTISDTPIFMIGIGILEIIIL